MVLLTKKHQVLFSLAWILTLGGSQILMEWIAQLLIGVGLINLADPNMASTLPVMAISIQIILNVLAALFAYMTTSVKSISLFSWMLVWVNGLFVLNHLLSVILFLFNK